VNEFARYRTRSQKKMTQKEVWISKFRERPLSKVSLKRILFIHIYFRSFLM